MAVQPWETSDQQQIREALPPNKLMGFCDHCQEWYKFDSDTDLGTCPVCNANHSHKIGLQLTTQRSFNPYARKMTKTQLKKMGGLG